ncbi:MAG: SRPBCC domain-containing protein, partial [Pseudolabrys sp.]
EKKHWRREMSNPSFVCVTYNRATPDKVWEALTKADLTEKYWFGYRVSAEGKPGDYMTAVSPSGMQAHHDPILESDPTASRVQLEAPLQGHSERTSVTRHLCGRGVQRADKADRHT